MRVRNEVLAAKCSDRWIGLRSPVSCAKPTTSEEAMVFDSVSVMPTERSSKNSVRSVSIAGKRSVREACWLRREYLVRGRGRSTGRRPARYHVHASANHGGAEPMAGGRHARIGDPPVAFGIIGLDLVEGPRWRLAADDDDPAIEDRRSNAAAGGRQGRTRHPAIGRGIVRLVGRQIARIVAVDAAADDVKQSIERGRGMV